MSAYLDVQNVYNAPNPEFYVFDYRFGERAGSGLPVLPTFGLTGAF